MKQSLKLGGLSVTNTRCVITARMRSEGTSCCCMCCLRKPGASVSQCSPLSGLPPREAKLTESNVLGVCHANSLEWRISATAQTAGLCLTPSPLSHPQLWLASSVGIASPFHCI